LQVLLCVLLSAFSVCFVFFSMVLWCEMLQGGAKRRMETTAKKKASDSLELAWHETQTDLFLFYKCSLF